MLLDLDANRKELETLSGVGRARSYPVEFEVDYVACDDHNSHGSSLHSLPAPRCYRTSAPTPGKSGFSFTLDSIQQYV